MKKMIKNKNNDRTIRIVCKGSGMELLSNLQIIQGDLKELNEQNLKKLRRRIETKGFDAPFFIWQNKILDGTQRKKVLDAMLADGWRLPEGKVPVCEIKAENLQDAKDRLLGYISQYGQITETGLSDFLSNLDCPDIENLSLPCQEGVTNEDLQALGKELHFSSIQLKPYKKTHILLSFPPELFATVSEQIEPLLSIDGIEYEQGSN